MSPNAFSQKGQVKSDHTFRDFHIASCTEYATEKLHVQTFSSCCTHELNRDWKREHALTADVRRASHVVVHREHGPEVRRVEQVQLRVVEDPVVVVAREQDLGSPQPLFHGRREKKRPRHRLDAQTRLK